MMIGNVILCANMFAGPGMSVTVIHIVQASRQWTLLPAAA